jgi:hypothetical protein
MDFMSFDLSWFKSLPGILLILGCFCLIIAIILIPTLTKKKDEFEVDLDPKEGEELLNKEEVSDSINNITTAPLNTSNIEEVKAPVENVMPVVENTNVAEPVEENKKIVIEPIADNTLVTANTEIQNNNPVSFDNQDTLNQAPTVLNLEPKEEAAPVPMMEEPKVDEVSPQVVNTAPVSNEQNITIPEVIPTIIENTTEVKEEIPVKNDSFGGEKLLPDDFKIEINEKKEAFGGEKLLPDDFKAEIEKPHLSNTQSFSLRDIAVQKEQAVEEPIKEEVKEVVETSIEAPVVEEKKKDDIELLEL